MTRHEFETWWTDYATVFPSVAAWLNSSGIDKSAIKVAWAGALAATGLPDALEVTRRMISGELEPVAAFDRELTAAKVRVAAESVRLQRHSQSLPKVADPIRDGRPRPFPFGSIFRHLTAMLEDGVPESERVAWLTANVPAADPESGPRFSCSLCCDEGHIDIAHWRLIQDFRRGGVNEAKQGIYRTMSVRCSCLRGNRGGSDNREPRYQPDEHCRVYGGDTESAAWWQRFESWHTESEEEKNTWKPQREFAQ